MTNDPAAAASQANPVHVGRVAAALWAALAGMLVYAVLLALRPEGFAVGGIPYFARMVAVGVAFVGVAVAARVTSRGREAASLRLALRMLWPAIAAFGAVSVAFA